MKILVTGARGQLGNEMRDVLERLNPGITTYIDMDDLDLADFDAVEKFLTEGDFSHVVNCAAYTAVERAEIEKSVCHRANVDAVSNLGRMSDRLGFKILHVSTDYVFDGNSSKPYTESDKVNPVSEYGISKRHGETALLGLAPDSIIVRTGWLYSSYGNNFVKTMLRLGRERKNINVVFDQIGTPTYGADLAEAIASMLFNRQWTPGIYNFANEGACSWYDFATVIFKMSNITDCHVSAITSKDYPSAVTRPHYSVLDKSKIKAVYGIEIPHWEEALARCLDRISEDSDI